MPWNSAKPRSIVKGFVILGLVAAISGCTVSTTPPQVTNMPQQAAPSVPPAPLEKSINHVTTTVPLFAPKTAPKESPMAKAFAPVPNQERPSLPKLGNTNIIVPDYLSLVAVAIEPSESRAAFEGELPWLENKEFQKATAVNHTPILLAAFRAALHDPIGSEAHNIALAARSLSGKVVPSGATFSLNRTLGPYTAEKGYKPGPNYVGNRVVIGVGGGVCKIATMLYNLTVLGDLPVVTRRAHSMVVPYVPPGQDATVSYSHGVDYVFRNNTSGPLLIWGEKVGDVLYMAFYGQEPPPVVRWHHEIVSHVQAPTYVRRTTKLAPGEEKEVAPGFDGYVVKSWALIFHPDGRTEQKYLGVSTYQMSARLVDRGI